MLDWFAELYIKIFTAIPPMVFEERTIHFTLFRVMLGMVAVTFILFLIAMRRK